MITWSNSFGVGGSKQISGQVHTLIRGFIFSRRSGFYGKGTQRAAAAAETTRAESSGRVLFGYLRITSDGDGEVPRAPRLPADCWIHDTLARSFFFSEPGDWTPRCGPPDLNHATTRLSMWFFCPPFPPPRPFQRRAVSDHCKRHKLPLARSCFQNCAER